MLTEGKFKELYKNLASIFEVRLQYHDEDVVPKFKQFENFFKDAEKYEPNRGTIYLSWRGYRVI